MTADQINALRDIFRVAMLNWDVPVSVTIVRFTLWGTKLDGWFNLKKGQWSDGNDCPHYITNSESVWQWIAMELHNQLPARR